MISNSSLRRVLAALFAVSLVASADTVGAGEAERPNVLFVMVDDLGKDWIGCYGADGIETPHVDALAKAGMTFHNAWSMPQCTPTRVTLLTGQYPFRTGWTNHWDVPRWGVGYFDWERYTTFARLLKDAGYATAIAGKWQINDFRLEPEALRKHGFDEWCVWTGYETGNPASGKRYWEPYIHENDGSRTHEGKFGPDVYADFLIDFLGRHRERPMLLYWPLCLTHGPLVHTPKEPDAAGKLEKHQAMVRYTDHLVGRVVGELDRLGIRDRTYVFFTTDNGTAGGLLGTIDGTKPRGGKASKFEGGVCMPFLVTGPGVPAGSETDAITDFSDLLPTFVELAGAKLPADTPLDGRSIVPVLRGEAESSGRDAILAMGHGPATLDEEGIRGVKEFAGRVLRDERFKVWVNEQREIDELYDLEADPLERTNLLEDRRALPEPARRALAEFEQAVQAMPVRDARPRYRPRAANAWDKQPRRAR